ncbi:hypothetical protein [Prevotella sp. 10(H)]|uniref:hypothetical protein n=1 Tax=Prevotella sp. 10(H) TaxID=1158294 RepID=UPI00068A503A|nr:hypothetical protein [Prevotella sp. 10(H)]
MKKFLYFIFICSLCVGFAGCGSDDDNNDDGDDNGKFVWNGNWNDENDPNYKPEGYNPIEGLWKNINAPRGIYFSKDFDAYVVTFYDDGTYKKSLWRENYIINNTGYRVSDGTWRYKFDEKGNFWTTPNKFDDNDWRIYTKVKE